MPKRRFVVHLAYVANIEIEAESKEEAETKGEDILQSNSVYSDDALDEMHDKAYQAGALGSGPPLMKKRAYQMRNMDFEPDEVSVIAEKEVLD